MKRLFLLIGIFLLCFTLISCIKDGEYTESLTEEMRNEIRLSASTKFNQNIKYIDVDYFLGGFDDKMVVILAKLWELNLNDCAEIQAGYEFNYCRRYNLTSTISVYYNNEFYGLQDALDKNLLTVDNIKIVKENFDKVFKEYDKEFFKITNELKDQGLTDDIYNELRKSYHNNYIDMYLGKYNDAYVALYLDFSSNIADATTKEYNGYVFEHHFYEGIRIIKDGVGYDIIKAIEKKIVDKNIYEYIFVTEHKHSSSEVAFHNNIICEQTLCNILKLYYDKYNVTNNLWNFESYASLVKSTKVYGDAIVVEFDFYDIELNTEPVVIEDKEYMFPKNNISYIYNNDDLYTIEDAYYMNIIDISVVEEIFK